MHWKIGNQLPSASLRLSMVLIMESQRFVLSNTMSPRVTPYALGYLPAEWALLRVEIIEGTVSDL